MSNRKTKTTSTGTLVGMILVGVLAVAGLAAYVKNAPADKVPEAVHRDRLKPSAPDVTIEQKPNRAQHTSVWVLQPVSPDGEPEYTKSELDVPVGADPHQFAVEQFIKNSGLAPESLRLLSVSVEDGVAKLMFNDAFKEIAVGSSAESVFLKGISISLSQFDGIKEMQFFADGQPVSSIGNVDLSVAIPLDTKAKVTAAPSKP